MISPTNSRVIYESDFSIFNGRLCSLRISSISHSEKRSKIRVSSSSDASILLDSTVEAEEYTKLNATLQSLNEARAQDKLILGPRVEPVSGETEFPFRLIVESNSLDRQTSAGAVVLQLSQPSHRTLKKRRCGCADDGELCTSDCDGEAEDDEEDDLESDLQMFRAATAQLQMSGREANNVEVSTDTRDSKEKQQMNFMKQFEKISSVIVKAPNMPSTSSMNMHIKMEEGQEQSGPLVLQPPTSSEVVGIVQYVICQLCPEEEQKSMDLSDQQQMEEHFMDKHVDKEKKTCEACPTDHIQPHNIVQHYRLHTNNVYACQQCGKRGRRNYLRSHVRIHTGERPFRCDICSKSFGDSSTLRRHRLIHTGEKKYQCPVCGRAIARKDNVKVHIRSHGIHL
ncbi:hypothetical protein CAEBREN_24765 [Caenorhabditis brenneri]|uniref:C2H2-type domain-containing protein n=1 Tax=Caenorhabditis brenneri TaxID=135651 RepID=G0NQ44_CAEBE|nr:hypothetical protein CAEBREN_24765 [Caenorhabditis brenneri]